ncbi:uncharacterized protein PGTG_18525 [Puccinia graminis f. sp. tritici CRL 75-36-700-3]|uniref:Uncharacterized protein n=1 Tax=Puccinia graminis f. sp. tritici (strain CRL 75-36-700-3 / race SCCL) TaxID=418459 RepID=E3L7K2_PUCGT|nr:uncharacterized protein PGTG_18525 [Puccinia graminis f. sp. tritici CRL 75-36-700-3]EFP92527.1 hypothetical protein PGTG_18525 [Puccinia graminis f. sp. tritici CRL 75-36-700-3]
MAGFVNDRDFELVRRSSLDTVHQLTRLFALLNSNTCYPPSKYKNRLLISTPAAVNSSTVHLSSQQNGSYSILIAARALASRLVPQIKSRIAAPVPYQSVTNNTNKAATALNSKAIRLATPRPVEASLLMLQPVEASLLMLQVQLKLPAKNSDQQDL